MKVLFNEEKVKQLLQDFQRFANVRIAVYDNNFNELFSCPKDRSSFCYTVRQNPEINAACHHCDMQAFHQSKANNDTYIYKCHLGLYEAVTPIYDNNQILGYVMIGQILSDDPSELQWKALISKYPRLIDSISPAKNSFFDLRQASFEDINSLVNIMSACATSIWLQHILSISQLPLVDKISSYLNLNYAEPIDTKKVCTDLNISKTTLYNTLKSEYNMALSQYLNHIRIKHATDLLESTKLPISEVANHVGYDDYNYFTKKFKALKGVTPSKYRKSL